MNIFALPSPVRGPWHSRQKVMKKSRKQNQETTDNINEGATNEKQMKKNSQATKQSFCLHQFASLLVHRASTKDCAFLAQKASVQKLPMRTTRASCVLSLAHKLRNSRPVMRHSSATWLCHCTIASRPSDCIGARPSIKKFPHRVHRKKSRHDIIPYLRRQFEPFCFYNRTWTSRRRLPHTSPAVTTCFARCMV